MFLKALMDSRGLQIFFGIFILSLLSLITLFVIDIVTEIKTYYYIAGKLFDVSIIVNSISLFFVIYKYKKSSLKALAIALVLPAIFFGYPALMDYIDMYQAKRNPDSFYYQP